MIKFQKFYVTDGVTKARVGYSNGAINVKQPDGSWVLRDCITLYAKDYDRSLGKVLPAAYVNDTDSMTDYFDQGHVRIFPGDALYAAAKARCDEWTAAREPERAAYENKLAQRRASRASGSQVAA